MRSTAGFIRQCGVRLVTRGPILYAVISMLLFPLVTHAQNIEITPFAGWMFAGSIATSRGELSISNTGNYGGAIDIGFPGLGKLELSYTHMRGVVRLREYRVGSAYRNLTNTSIEYYQVGTLIEHPHEGIIFYGLVTGGVAVLNPSDGGYSSTTRFAFSAGGGMKIPFSDRIALRLQGRLLMPLFGSGGYIFGGTGGLGFGLSAGVPILQGDLTGGLTFSL